MPDATYDPETDIFYIAIGQGKVTQSAEIAEGVVFDFDAKDLLIGIEISNAHGRLAPGAWGQAPKPENASVWSSHLAADAERLHPHSESLAIDDWIERVAELDD